ncbi:MAG: ion channel [Flavobacteriales bacterium]|nr:ion channel [Flavobacteriales bacterium]MDG1765773.1 ion channel [Flavobacteriales bacterium]
MRQQAQDPGFGSKYGNTTKRIINKDGSFNVVREGIDSGIRDLYQGLITISNLRFVLNVTLLYFILNALFALFYLFNGVENLSGGLVVEGWDAFFKSFYFSVQTFTTVGYGAVAPLGFGANSIASIEALAGSMYFALVTGVLYGRFSRPKSKLIFSEKAIIAPYGDKQALMFRLANRRSNVLMKMKAEVIFMIKEDENDPSRRSYYNLPLELDQVQFLPLSWTVVHPIDEDSPLFGLNHQQLMMQRAEVMILIFGFDDTFNQDVHARYSYTADEFEFDAKFKPAFELRANGEAYMNINKIHDYDKLN